MIVLNPEGKAQASALRVAAVPRLPSFRDYSPSVPHGKKTPVNSRPLPETE